MTFNRRGNTFLAVAVIGIIFCLAVICFADVPYVINNKSEQNKEYHTDENFYYLETYKAPKDNPTFTGTVTATDITVTSVTASGEITTGYGYYHARANPQDADFKTTKFTMDTNWNDLDISTIVPVGAKTVHLGVYGYDDHSQTWMKFRKNGDTGGTGYYLCWITNAEVMQTVATIICPVDTGRVIEYKASEAISDINIAVLGWWK